jgi:acyl-CoA synthetase (NDP forming)
MNEGQKKLADKELEVLDSITEKVAAENGTIMTQVLNYDRAIQRQMAIAAMAGATREQISAVLLKYLDIKNPIN